MHTFCAPVLQSHEHLFRVACYTPTYAARFAIIETSLVVSVFVSRYIVFFFTLARHNAGEKVAINNTMILEKKIWTEKVIIFFFVTGMGIMVTRRRFQPVSSVILLRLFIGFLVSRKPCCLALGVDISCFLPLSEKEGTKQNYL